MLQEQQKYWDTYPDYIKEQLEVIVVDDCSPNKPAKDYINPNVEYDLSLYRIQKNVRWNWLACRNLGAYKAKNKWLLLTDMDHAVDSRVIKNLWRNVKHFDDECIYMFERKDAPNLTQYKPHDDSYFMTRGMFWKVGGYDEDLSGFYGTSGNYRRRAGAKSKRLIRLKGLYLIRYPREVIADASTSEFTRKDPAQKEKLKKIIDSKKHARKPIKTLSFPYEEICLK